MLAFALGGWCVLLAMLSISADVGGFSDAASLLHRWALATFFAFAGASVATAAANLVAAPRRARPREY